MLVSCLCVCHNKPLLAREALASIVGQSYPNWEAVIVDSGVLFDASYYDGFGWRQDKRFRLVRSGETEEVRRTRAMAPWCFNECYRRGLVRGDLVVYLCDDDLLYPNAFATFVSYCRQHPDAQAMYASQDIGLIFPDGWRAIIGERRATVAGGKSCGGRVMDGEVDYLQFCHRREVLGQFPCDEFWPEGKESESHADGLFMERVGERVPIHPIDVKVSQNRRTPDSTYTPFRSRTQIESILNGTPSLAPSAPPQAPQGPLVTVCVASSKHGAGLPDVLRSLAVQTYPRLEVVVVDHSADPSCAETVEGLRSRYPRIRFLTQIPGGAESPWDQGLREARGELFLLVDGDTIACPDMVEQLVAGMRRDPELAALACHTLDFQQPPAPAGGGESLASVDSVPGRGIFHTAKLRAAGGFAAEGSPAGGACQGFFNLVNRGCRVDILPQHLFYRSSASRASDLADGFDARGSESVLAVGRTLAAERMLLLEDCRRRVEELTEQRRALQVRVGSLRYRLADRLHALSTCVPLLERGIRWVLGRRRKEPPASVPLPLAPAWQEIDS